ncbi:MAG: site-specific integrase [Deltaproteobacteria bacterium]|nr:site-specific integrase [Deltaproteobacteria bacterium]
MNDGKKTTYPGILRVGEGEYQVRVTYQFPEGGQRERKLRVKGTLIEAVRAREDEREKMRVEAEREAKQIGYGMDPKLAGKETLSVYSRRWLTHLVRTGRNRVHVVKQHTHILTNFILPELGDMKVEALTRRDLVVWMEELGDKRIKTKDGDRPYAKQTLTGVWATFRTMLHDALVLCDLKDDPTQGLRFRVRGLEPVEKDVLTKEELAKVLTATEHESPDMRAMIWVGFTTGMRFGELSALQWSDIDFERGLIHVRKSQVKGVVGPTKTSSRRTVPLHPVVAGILTAHKAWQEMNLVRGRETGFLFLSELGGLRFSNVLTKPLKNCVVRAGIGDKKVTSHTMRRTFNNLARQAAGDIVARSMTGHTTMEMTEHYSHVTLEEKNKAVAKALGLPEMTT